MKNQTRRLDSMGTFLLSSAALYSSFAFWEFAHPLERKIYYILSILLMAMGFACFGFARFPQRQ